MSSFVFDVTCPEINGSMLPKRSANAARRTQLERVTPSAPR